MKFVSFAARGVSIPVNYSFDACILPLSVRISSSLLRLSLLRLSTPGENVRAASRNTEVRRVPPSAVTTPRYT